MDKVKMLNSKSELLYSARETLFGSSPYGRTEEEQKAMLAELIISDNYLFMDKKGNPDLGFLSVHRVESRDLLADLGRTSEANVFRTDYGYSRAFIEKHFRPYDNNSFFFIAINQEVPEKPEIVGLLRVIECNEGNSETVSMFREFYGNKTPLPIELNFADTDDTVWDIFTVAVNPKYRNGFTSLWLYHALYRSSLEKDVKKWIANITPGEIRNLRDRLGIPFQAIPGTGLVFDEMPNGKRIEYGFYHMNVSDVEPAALCRIAELEQDANNTELSDTKRKMSQLLLKITKTAFRGMSEY